MGDDPKWFSWAHIIDPTKRPASWWKRHNPTFATSISVLSLMVAGMSAWYAREKLISEQRPMLEITSFEFMDKNNLKMLAKNSGRSSAIKLHNDMWCDIGKYVGGLVGPALKVEKSTSTGLQYMPDVPTGATFTMYTFIPGELWFIQDGVHYTNESSLRLRGVLHYEDAEHNRFELPWCYESFQPKAQVKPGAIPCYDVPVYKMP
jgi:hypothetical protein